MGWDETLAWGTPAVALSLVAVLALVLRWTYGRQRPVPPSAAAGDYGLLRDVVVVGTQADAEAVCDILADADIRATTAPHGEGFRVLVFPADLSAAQAVVGPSA